MGQAGMAYRWRHKPLRTEVVLTLVGVSYYLIAELGLRLALVGHSVTPLWPPTGFALVAFLVFGRRVWPAVTIAAFAVNLPISPNALTAVAIAIGNTLAPLVAAALLDRVHFDHALARVRDAFALVFLAALLSMSVSASIGTFALLWSGAIAHQNTLGTWSVWWTGDAMGVLIIAPVLLLFTLNRSRSAGSRRYLEATIVTIVLVAGCVAAFSLEKRFMFVVLPVVGLIAWRFQQRGAAPAALFVSVYATLAAVHETGPFADVSLLRRMVLLQSFNATVAFVAVLLTAAVAEREGFAQREHRIAETLQRSLLPEQLACIGDVNAASRYIPATTDVEVGGDWYDIVPRPDGSIGFVVGDVVGHGVVAAAAMGQLRMALRAYAVENLAPHEALHRCNRVLRDLAPSGMATIWYGCYNPLSHALTFSSAGHPPVLLVDGAGHARYLDAAHGPPIGAFANLEYRTSECELPSDAILVLYTDGLVERRRTPLDEGLAALQQAAAQGPRDLELMCDYLVEKLVVGPTDDDIALLVVRPALTSDRSLRVSHASSPHSTVHTRRLVRSWLNRQGVPEHLSSEVLVAVSEAYCNAMEHAYGLEPGPIEIDGSITDGTLEVTVRDHGSWRQRATGNGNDGGRGLILMQGLMDHVDIETNGNGTVVHMRRALNTPADHS